MRNNVQYLITAFIHIQNIFKLLQLYDRASQLMMTLQMTVIVKIAGQLPWTRLPLSLDEITVDSSNFYKRTNNRKHKNIVYKHRSNVLSDLAQKLKILKLFQSLQTRNRIRSSPHRKCPHYPGSWERCGTSNTWSPARPGNCLLWSFHFPGRWSGSSQGLQKSAQQ